MTVIVGDARRRARPGRCGGRLAAVQEADQHHRRRVLPAGAGAVSGDKVQIMGVRVGTIDKIEPAGDKMRVTFNYENKYKVPANATASILNPSLVASRTIQLSPAVHRWPGAGEQRSDPDRADPGAGGVGRPAQPDHRHRQPSSGPRPNSRRARSGTSSNPSPTGWPARASRSTRRSMRCRSAITALNEGRGDFFAVAKSLALFVNALHQSDQQFVELNNNLAEFTNSFNNGDQEVATALKDIDGLLTTAQQIRRRQRFGAGHRTSTTWPTPPMRSCSPSRATVWRRPCTSSRTWLPTW